MIRFRLNYKPLAIVMALLAALLTYGYLSSWEATVSIPVAAFDIPPMTKVEPSFLRMVQTPARGLLPGVTTRPDDVVGQYTRTAVFAGETFMPSKLAGGNPQTAWKGYLEADTRVFSIPVTASRACGGALEPGDLVDVYFAGSSQRTGAGQATRILRSVPVLDLRDEEGNSLYRPGHPRNISGMAAVLVRVTPTECSILALCLEQGHVYLAIAPPDSEESTAVSASLKDLLPQER